jgi:hypothetical protein
MKFVTKSKDGGLDVSVVVLNRLNAEVGRLLRQMKQMKTCRE